MLTEYFRKATRKGLIRNLLSHSSSTTTRKFQRTGKSRELALEEDDIWSIDIAGSQWRMLRSVP